MSNTYKIKPQGARVLLVLHSKVEKVIGGVILPNAAQDDFVRHANVVEWGMGCVQPWSVNDTVMIGKDAGLPVKMKDGFEYVLIPEDDILAVMTEESGGAVDV
jgi:co-chaperonin GroES (HSP10)